MSRKRMFTEEFKLQVLSEADSGVPIGELTRRYELSTGMIAKWRQKLKGAPRNPFPGKGSRNTDRAKFSEMERLIGRQSIEIDFLKNALARLKENER